MHKVHEGRNVKRFREMLQIKQEALAFDLGDDWNQQKISLLEQKETIEPALLQQISKIMNIPVDVFQNMDDEQVVNIISNTFNTHDHSNGMNVYPTFNDDATDKVMQLHEEKMALYERMIKAQDDMIARLEKLIEVRNN